MLAAIDTSTISSFVDDHPAEAYGIAGAVILLLVLLLMINRRQKRQGEEGQPTRRHGQTCAATSEGEHQWSPLTRLVAEDAKARKRPSVLIAGLPELVSSTPP